MVVKKKVSLNEDGIETTAGATLHPHSDNASHAGDPKSRFEHIASMIGATHAMRDDELTKWWKQAVDLIGKEGREIPGGLSGKNSSSIDMKPSDAPVSSVSKHSYSEAMPKLKEAIQNDLAKILEGQEGLSEDFKTKAAVLFETAVTTLVRVKEEEMQAEMDKKFDEEVEEIVISLAEATDEMLNQITEKWFVENEVAIESSLRNELSEDFIIGLKNLFVEHFIDVPQEKVDIVDSLAEKVDELESQLAETMTEAAELRKQLDETIKEKIVEEACEGLTLADAEKLIDLAEAISADDNEEFANKLTVIKESNFVKGSKSNGGQQSITEQMEEVDPDNEDNKEPRKVSPGMRYYVDAISRTTRK